MVKSKDWQVVSIVSEIHVVPLHDTTAHSQDSRCWCNPELVKEEDTPIYVHQPADHRDLFEELRARGIKI